MKKTRLLLFGSTGSIGLQTLEVIRLFPEKFEIVGLTVKSSISELEKQVREFGVKSVSILDEKAAEEFSQRNTGIIVFSGEESLEQMVEETGADLVVMALVGEIGISPTKKAIEKGIDIALATKEVLVAEGEEIMHLAREKNVEIRPIDSEHSAIWQCLRGRKRSEVAKIWLTCSGGPFRDAVKWPIERLKSVTPEEAIAHPNWDMGKKISVDSATLMNKALELIEAVQLFNLSPNQIEVVVHPQSHLHSAVEFRDGSIIGQIGTPDMRIPIAHALFAPENPPLPFPKFDFFGQQWNFEKVDTERFPSLELAREAIQKNKCAPFNKANEKAVADFLGEDIGFLDIFERVRESLK